MNIGIAVVYLVSERNGPLLDLHLRQIDMNTENPYTLYACINGLGPRFRPRLEEHPHVKICPCETYPGGSTLWPVRRGPVRASEGIGGQGSGTSGPAPDTQPLTPETPDGVPTSAVQRQSIAKESKYEHSWYLEQLIHTAMADGVTHMAMFHVDSFPVRRGWDTELIRKFSNGCVLAGITRDPLRDQKPLTACTMFPREFYLQHRPRLLLSREEMGSEAYTQYLQACPHESDSGFGYGFKMFLEGLSWYPMVKSNPHDNRTLFASIYDDLIFHLHATVFIERTKSVGFTLRPTQRGGFLGGGARLARALFPEWLRQKIRHCVSPRVDAHYQHGDRESWERERRRLFDDPDGYLRYLRTGIQA